MAEYDREYSAYIRNLNDTALVLPFDIMPCTMVFQSI